MKIKIEATIEVDKAYGEMTDPEEREWFKSVMEDKKYTSLILWSNDVGDEIGNTNDFKYTISK